MNVLVKDLIAWTDVGAVTDIPLRGARRVPTPDGDIAIFRNASDEVFALHDKCPHKNGPLSQGIVHGKRVTCPLHGWKIQFENGEAIAPDTGCAKHYPSKVESGAVWIAL